MQLLHVTSSSNFNTSLFTYNHWNYSPLYFLLVDLVSSIDMSLYLAHWELVGLSNKMLNLTLTLVKGQTGHLTIQVKIKFWLFKSKVNILISLTNFNLSSMNLHSFSWNSNHIWIYLLIKVWLLKVKNHHFDLFNFDYFNHF